jgi:hypothetical protein
MNTLIEEFDGLFNDTVSGSQLANLIDEVSANRISSRSRRADLSEPRDEWRNRLRQLLRSALTRQRSGGLSSVCPLRIISSETPQYTYPKSLRRLVVQPIVKHVWGGTPLPFPILLGNTFQTWERFGLPGLGTVLLIDPEGNLLKGDEAVLAEKLKERVSSK